MRSMPVTGEQILGGKVLGTAIFVLIPVLVITLAVILFLGLRGFRLIIAAAFVLLVTPGLAAIGAWCGSVSPNFAAQNIRQRAGGIAHLFYWIASLGYAAFLAAGVFLVSAGAWTGWRFWLRMLGLVWLPAVAAAAVIVPVVFGGMDIDRREASLH